MEAPTENDKLTDYESDDWKITKEGDGKPSDADQDNPIQDSEDVKDGYTDPNSGYWHPETDTIEEGRVFTQKWIFNSGDNDYNKYEFGGTMINGLSRQNTGTKVASWTPDPATKCYGVDFTQTARNSNGSVATPIKTRVIKGTSVSNWSDWTPEKDTICDGVRFTQVRKDLNGVCTQQEREEYGILSCDGWLPDVFSYCTGVKFLQKNYVYGKAIDTRPAEGLSSPDWSDWAPNSDLVCIGTKLKQSSIDLLGKCGTRTREIEGTKECGGYWHPDTDTIDEGVKFDQTWYSYESESGSQYGGGGGSSTGRTRKSVGTKTNITEWELDPSKVCLGEKYKQVGKLKDGTYAVPAQYKDAVGTSTPDWSDWAPDPSTRCIGVQFIQESRDLNLRCTTRQRLRDGIKTCDGWSPDPSTVCKGKKFIQYKYFDNGTQIFTGPGGKQIAYGTGTGNWTPWFPHESTICYDVEFNQQSIDLNGICGSKIRAATGTGTPPDCDYYFE